MTQITRETRDQVHKSTFNLALTNKALMHYLNLYYICHMMPLWAYIGSKNTFNEKSHNW